MTQQVEVSITERERTFAETTSSHVWLICWPLITSICGAMPFSAQKSRTSWVMAIPPIADRRVQSGYRYRFEVRFPVSLRDVP